MHPEVICLDSDSDCNNSPIAKRATATLPPPAQPSARVSDGDTDTDDELLKPTITDRVRATPFVSACTIDLDEDSDFLPKPASSPSVVSTPSPPKKNTRNENHIPIPTAPVPRAGTDADDCIIIVDDDENSSPPPPRIEWDTRQNLGSSNARACANSSTPNRPDKNSRRITAQKPPRNKNDRQDTDFNMTSSESSSLQGSLFRNLRAIKPSSVRLSAPLGSSIVPKKVRKKTKTSPSTTTVAPAIVPDSSTERMDMTMAGVSSDIDIEGGDTNAADDSMSTSTIDMTIAVPSGKGRKKKKRDRDEVRIVSSSQLMKKREYKEIMKKMAPEEMSESMLNLVFTKVDELAVPNLIEWRRTGQFDERVTVDAVAYWYTATDFVELMREGKVEGIATTLRSSYPCDVSVFMIVSGIASYCRKAIKNAANNGNEMDGNILITRDALEDCAASLWFHHGMESKMFDTAKECATFLVCTAYAIGRKEYNSPLARSDLRDAYVHGKTAKEHASLCVDSDTGDVRAETRADTGAGYQAILALVPGVSNGKAKTIRKSYPTLKALLKAYRDCSDTQTAQKLLANEKYNNRKLGNVLSFKLWKVLAANDPDISIA